MRVQCLVMLSKQQRGQFLMAWCQTKQFAGATSFISAFEKGETCWTRQAKTEHVVCSLDCPNPYPIPKQNDTKTLNDDCFWHHGIDVFTLLLLHMVDGMRSQSSDHILPELCRWSSAVPVSQRDTNRHESVFHSPWWFNHSTCEFFKEAQKWPKNISPYTDLGAP